MDKDYKLEVKVGDKVTIKNTGGNYSTYTNFFYKAKDVLISQMGEVVYKVTKDSYCKEVESTYDGVKTDEHGTYCVLGFAPHDGVNDDDRYNPEVLVLKGEKGEIRLFSNFKRYF